MNNYTIDFQDRGALVVDSKNVLIHYPVTSLDEKLLGSK